MQKYTIVQTESGSCQHKVEVIYLGHLSRVLQDSVKKFSESYFKTGKNGIIGIKDDKLLMKKALSDLMDAFTKSEDNVHEFKDYLEFFILVCGQKEGAIPYYKLCEENELDPIEDVTRFHESTILGACGRAKEFLDELPDL